MNQIKAIETRYAGCRFRSRLEAKWAVFFDALDIEWEHEPEGFETSAGRYLPDFKIQIPGNQQEGKCQWFEVKPAEWREDRRHAALASESGNPLIVARGMPRSYADQMQASEYANRLDSPLMIHGVEDQPWPVAFCDSSAAGWSSAHYCTLGANRHWCQDHTHQHLAGIAKCHLALYGKHVNDNGSGYMTHPPIEGRDVDAAYAAARSERFGT